MTENHFEYLIRLDVIRGIRLIRVPADSVNMRLRIEVTLANGEAEYLHGSKGAIKLYRPETAIEFLASLGLNAVVVDLTSCREHHIAIQP